MKAICPISGVPFRTYDSLPLEIAVDHPIFSISFHELVRILDTIKNQEIALIESFGPNSLAEKSALLEAASIKDLTNSASLAIHEKNWTNPAFKLYQTKHLVMLAFMHMADLIEVEKGYAARPKPEIVDSHFWNATELFVWANTLSNPQLQRGLPRYRVSRDNEGMANLPEYLEEFNKIKESIGIKYRTYSTERKLAAWEEAIAILSRRREVLKTKLSTSTNNIAARWALTITNCPKDYWDFWYAILSSPSTKITFEGVRIGDRYEAVTAGDLRELHDWIDDNLVRPKGERGVYHRDDSEFYYIARQTVLDIIRTHILILEQGTSSYKIVNSAVGNDIIMASDDLLETKAIEAGLSGKPKFTDHPTKVEFIKAVARWRTFTKNTLVEMTNIPKTEEQRKEEAKYDIL